MRLKSYSSVSFLLAIFTFCAGGILAQTGGGFNANINFQPASAPVPAGYMADTGAVYGDRGNGYAYGWNADSSAYTRDRNATTDQRYDTLNHMLFYGTFTWEIEVPNGTYSVHVVAGDPANYDVVAKINVEGVLTVDGANTSTTPWIEGTQTVTVTDGKLTVSNAAGASNNKICFIDITSAGSLSPTVSITSPNEGANFTPSNNIPISANATDNDGTVSKVEFYANASLIGIDTSSPYSYTWSRMAAGSYALTAKATDNTGAATISNSVNITVSSSTNNISPSLPTITEPSSEGQIVHPADVHMATAPLSDANTSDTHTCTDWEIRTFSSPLNLVWASSPCNYDGQNAASLVHVHFGDGTFQNGYTALEHDKDYVLRVRHKDSSGDPVTEWSQWAERRFHTSPTSSPGTSVAWAVKQPGYQVEVVATGFQLPVNIAFAPNAGSTTGKPTDPYLYVAEMYGQIKVVHRDGTVSEYVRGLLNYRPSGVFPGDGEQGLAGLVVDPISGDLFVSMLYESSPGGARYPKVVRFRSNESGTLAGSSKTILDMPGETMIESHQISNLTIGPDGKLYVHMGDGFDVSTPRNLNSFRGKILRLNLDGTPATDNPFYNASDGINAKDYVFAFGFRNPFGGAWRAADNHHYEVENGPSIDRLAKVIAGRDFMFDGSNASMYYHAIYNWSPAVGPVNIAFVQPETFGGSGFPTEKKGHAFVTESGPTWASGPQGIYGKRISEFVLDASGNRVSGPMPFVEYTGTGKATAVGLAAGPDGLYFTDFYKDLNFTSPIDAGANILRIRYMGTTPPNAPPTVGITSPSEGTTFPAPANITITAVASDSDGTVAKVEFFQGTTKLGEDTTADNGNYSFTWGNVSAGTYTLRAKATDNTGAVTTSSEVNIAVYAPSNTLPTVSITAPPAGATFTAPANIIINATAADVDGAVNKVEFYQGSTKLGEDTAAPYSYNWSNVLAGSFTLTAKAVDNAGASNTSSPVSITVASPPNAAPTVSLTNPTEGATFTAPANITINANASDSDGTISKVDFYAGSTLIGTDTAAPYSMVWSNVGAGTYTLTAKATDNVGATRTSSVINVTVNGSDPSFSLSTSPSSRNIKSGAQTSYTISVSPSGGFTGNVTFSVNGVLPTGVSVSFSPQSVNTSGSSTMTVGTSSTTPAGSYMLTIIGSSGSLQRTKSVTLNIRK